MPAPAIISASKGRCDSLSTITKLSLIVALMLAWIAFLPTLEFDYVPQDQWRAFRYKERSASGKLQAIRQMLPPFYVRTGRPLVWIGECLEHTFVNRISDFRFLRPFSLLIYLGAGFALALALYRACGIMPLALAISLLFLFTPGVSFMYFQGMTGAPVTLCVGLAAISYYWMAGPPLRWIAARGRSWACRELLAGLAFMTALMIYPAWAMIVLPLSLLAFAFREPQSNRERAAQLLKTCVFYLACTLLYFAVSKTAIAANFAGSRDLHHLGRYEFSMHLAPRILWSRFLGVVNHLRSASILPVLGWGKGSAVLLFIAFSVWVGVKLAAGMKSSGRWSAAMKAVTCAIAAFLATTLFLAGSVSPWLVSGMDGFATRHVVPINLFLIAIALLGVWKVGTMLHQRAGLLAVLCICALAALTQHKLSTCEVVTSGLEIAEMRKGVAEWLDAAGPAKHQGIVVVRPSDARLRIIEELNIPAEALGDNSVLASRCNPEHIWQMINALTREHSEYRTSPTPEILDCRFDQRMALDAISRGQIVLQLTESGEYVGGEQDQFVINLSSLGGQHKTPHNRTLDLGSPGCGKRAGHGHGGDGGTAHGGEGAGTGHRYRGPSLPPGGT